MRQLPTRHIDFILRVVNICNALLLGVGAYLAFDDAYGWAFQAATGLCFKCDAELNPPCGNAFILVPRVFLGTYIVLFALLIIAVRRVRRGWRVGLAQKARQLSPGTVRCISTHSVCHPFAV